MPVNATLTALAYAAALSGGELFASNPLLMTNPPDGAEQCTPGRCTLCLELCQSSCHWLSAKEVTHCTMCGIDTSAAGGCAPHAKQALELRASSAQSDFFAGSGAEKRAFYEIMAGVHNYERSVHNERGLALFSGDAVHGDQFIQRMVLWVCSLGADIFVIAYHMTHPPHPKFTVTGTIYRYSIKFHAACGSLECILGPIIFCVAPGGARTGLLYAMLTCGAIHIVTAWIQTPRVFGQRKVMVPAYCVCIGLKMVCWVMLVLNLHEGPYRNLNWFMSLVCVHHIYAWCRVFVFIFASLRILREHEYTVAIMFAGMLMTPPGLGVAFPLLYWFVIAVFGKGLEVYLDHPKHKAEAITWEIESPRQAYLCEWYTTRFREVFNKTIYRVKVGFIAEVNDDLATLGAEMAEELAMLADLPLVVANTSVVHAVHVGTAHSNPDGCLWQSVPVPVCLGRPGDLTRPKKSLVSGNKLARMSAKSLKALHTRIKSDTTALDDVGKELRDMLEPQLDHKRTLTGARAVVVTLLVESEAKQEQAGRRLEEAIRSVTSLAKVRIRGAEVRYTNGEDGDGNALPLRGDIQELDDLHEAKQAEFVFRVFDKSGDGQLEVREVGAIFLLFGCPAEAALEAWESAGLGHETKMGLGNFMRECKPLWQFCCLDMAAGAAYMRYREKLSSKEAAFAFVAEQLKSEVAGPKRRTVAVSPMSPVGAKPVPAPLYANSPAETASPHHAGKFGVRFDAEAGVAEGKGKLKRRATGLPPLRAEKDDEDEEEEEEDAR